MQRLLGRRCFILIALLAFAVPAAFAAEDRDPYRYFFASGTDDFRAELADAKRLGKKALFVMYEQDGCPSCIYMKKHVLNRAGVQKYYRDHFINFSININGSIPFDDFAGRNVTEKAFSRAIGIKVTPTLIFYDLEGREVIRVTGAIRDPARFIALGEFVSSGAYRGGKFADYLKGRRKGS